MADDNRIKEHYKFVDRPGVVAILINSGKVLLLKRRNIPFITNPGIWFFVTGGLKKGERPIDAAYRELNEETGIERRHLKKLSEFNVELFDKKKGWYWKNRCFIFYSDKKEVKLNIENTKYRWASFNEIEEGSTFSNIFIKGDHIIRLIKGVIDGIEKKTQQDF